MANLVARVRYAKGVPFLIVYNEARMLMTRGILFSHASRKTWLLPRHDASKEASQLHVSGTKPHPAGATRNKSNNTAGTFSGLRPGNAVGLSVHARHRMGERRRPELRTRIFRDLRVIRTTPCREGRVSVLASRKTIEGAAVPAIRLTWLSQG